MCIFSNRNIAEFTGKESHCIRKTRRASKSSGCLCDHTAPATVIMNYLPVAFASSRGKKWHKLHSLFIISRTHTQHTQKNSRRAHRRVPANISEIVWSSNYFGDVYVGRSIVKNKSPRNSPLLVFLLDRLRGSWGTAHFLCFSFCLSLVRPVYFFSFSFKRFPRFDKKEKKKRTAGKWVSSHFRISAKMISLASAFITLEFSSATRARELEKYEEIFLFVGKYFEFPPRLMFLSSARNFSWMYIYMYRWNVAFVNLRVRLFVLF